MAIQIQFGRNGNRPQLERMPDAGTLLLLARRRRIMTQDQVAERGGYKSRHTVMRWEQGKLPDKDTPAARV